MVLFDCWRSRCLDTESITNACLQAQVEATSKATGRKWDRLPDCRFRFDRLDAYPTYFLDDDCEAVQIVIAMATSMPSSDAAIALACIAMSASAALLA